MFTRLARHLPGLGGVATLDEMSWDTAIRLMDEVASELRAEADAIRSQRAKG